MTATRLPWWAVRMWLRRVVLPAPRNPVRTVTGTRSFVAAAMLVRPRRGVRCGPGVILSALTRRAGGVSPLLDRAQLAPGANRGLTPPARRATRPPSLPRRHLDRGGPGRLA